LRAAPRLRRAAAAPFRRGRGATPVAAGGAAAPARPLAHAGRRPIRSDGGRGLGAAALATPPPALILPAAGPAPIDDQQDDARDRGGGPRAGQGDADRGGVIEGRAAVERHVAAAARLAVERP